jgi:hypothetical protein
VCVKKVTESEYACINVYTKIKSEIICENRKLLSKVCWRGRKDSKGANSLFGGNCSVLIEDSFVSVLIFQRFQYKKERNRETDNITYHFNH